MRLYFLNLALFWLLISLHFENTIQAQNSNTHIKEIRQKYSTLHQELPLLDSIQKNLDGSSEGGLLTGYYKDKKLLVIKTIYYGETGYLATEYYLENEVPFFIFQRKSNYNRPFYYNQKTAQENRDSTAFNLQKSTFEESRFYFYEKSLIRWLTPSHTLANPSSKIYLDKAQELLSHVKILKARLTK